jgi:hypothetical protein
VEDARATGRERRGLGGDSNGERELYATSARPKRGSSSPSGSARTQPGRPEPVLIVGNVNGLFPSVVTITSNETGKPIHVQVPDWRRLRGFEPILKAAIASNLGYQDAQTARMKSVKSNRDALSSMKALGHRQMIYFGHGGGAGTGIFPEGIEKAPISDKNISAALPKGAPLPIIVACWGSEVQITRNGESTSAIGTRRTLIVRDWQLDVPESRARKKSDPVRAQDLVVKSITLDYGRYDAPDVQLRNHTPPAIEGLQPRP